MPKVLQVVDVPTALEIYYKYPHIGTKQIKALFGGIGDNSIVKLRAKARNQMVEDKQPKYNSSVVNTKSAYKAWGIDINELEHNFSKLKKLGFIKNGND